VDPPRFVGLDNFVRAFTSEATQLVFLRTALFTAAVIAVEFTLGLGLALLAVHRVKRGTRLFRTLLILPMAMTPVAAGLIWRWLFDPDKGLINYFLSLFGVHPIFWLGTPMSALLSLAIVEVWQWTPLVFLMMLAGVSALPTEPLEAARVDGASPWQVLRMVTLPMLSGLIMVVLVIRSVDALKLFDTIFVMTEGGPGTSTELLSYSIYKTAFRYFNVGQGSALAWIMLVMVLLISSRFINRIAKEEFAPEETSVVDRRRVAVSE
jgi:multiple sugar transport system permease protein